MELTKKKEIMRVVNIVALIMTLCLSGYCQDVDGKYFSFKRAKSPNPELILIRGIVLDRDSIKPVENLPPLITYLKWKTGEEGKFHYEKDGKYNKDNGTFSFYLPPGKYKFMCSQLGYTEIVTDWIKIEECDLGMLFLLKNMKVEVFISFFRSKGFHNSEV